jgi:hypothetical protein
MSKTKLAIHASENTDDVIDIPYGASRGRRSDTQVSQVGGGRHFNFYLSDALIELARSWPLGAEIKLRRVDGKPDVICFRQATQKAYSLRSRSGTMRPAIVIETTTVESWVDGDEICVRMSGLFSTEKEA